MIRLSANLGFLWPNLPLTDRIAAAGKAGFKAVEFHWPYDVPAADVKAALERAGTQPLALNTLRGDTFGLAAQTGMEREFRDSFDQALAYVLAIGGSAIHVMAGVVAPIDKTRATATLVSNLAAAADKAARHNITLLLEPLNPRDRPDYFYSRQSEAAEIIARLDLPNIKLMADTYHMGVSEGDILRKLEHFLPIIGHIQIAAVPSRAEPDEGEIDYRAVLRHIAAIGYQGWVGAEYLPRADTDAGLIWMKTLLG